MRFGRIIGHDEIKERLIRSVESQRISHAQLFIGPEGNGKLAMAIAYAQYINCTNKQYSGNNNRIKSDSCGTCASCKKFEKLIHPDLHFVFPVIKNKKFKDPVSDNYLKEWREFISESPYRKFNTWLDFINAENAQGSIFTQESKEIIRKLNLKTYEAEYKVMIIWLPEKMNESASNKLLKMIEEPPSKTLFLLVSEDEGKIIRTILSRTQIVKIPKFEDKNILGLIKRESLSTTTDEAELDFFVKLSNGNVIKTYEITRGSADNSGNFEDFTTLMRLAYSAKIVDLVKWTENIARTGREKQKNFLEYSLRIIRENLMMNLAPEKQQIVFLNKDESKFSSKFHPFITAPKAAKLYQEFNKAHTHIMRNVAPKIVFLDMALQATIIIKSK